MTHDNHDEIQTEEVPEPVKASTFYANDTTTVLTEEITGSKKPVRLLIIAVSIVAIIVLVISGITLYTQTDWFYPKNPDAPTTAIPEGKIVNSSNAIPLSKTMTSEDILKEAGAPKKLQVIFTDEPNLNCGYRKMVSQFGKESNYKGDSENWVAGCYQSTYADYIFVYWGTEVPFEYRKASLLHEYGHYTQRQDAPDAYLKYNKGDASVIEADADCRALDMGAVKNCTIPNWSPSWLRSQ